MRLAILGSGSSGNVALVESGGTRVLVDAGLSVAAITKRLDAVGVALEEIDALLVTHEHSDHVGCAATLGRPIHAPGATLLKKRLVGTRVLAGRRFVIGALTVDPVMLIHDADETVGYVFSDGRHRIGILTDCGQADAQIARSYAGCDVLVLEANHDPRMLVLGPYPPSLQRRVRGPRGHLSNEQSASMLQLILAAGAAPSLVIAAHISQKNNHDELVREALQPHLPSHVPLVLATPAGSPEVRLPLPGARPRQLALFDRQALIQ
ncbi:MAG: MBL fold metallo-hydrolase [Polyangia bacterium]